MKAELNDEVSERFQKFGLALVVVVGIVAHGWLRTLFVLIRFLDQKMLNKGIVKVSL